MKVVLGKYRVKDDSSGFGGSAQIQLLQAKIENIGQILQHRHTQLEECEEKARSGLESNAENLVARIEEEKEKLNEHINKVQSESLMNKETVATDALKELRQLKKKFDETMEKINTYRQYEETLKVEEPVPVPQIEIFNKLFNKSELLWKSRNDFKGFREEWYFEDFLKQNAEAIVKQVKDYNTQNMQMKLKMNSEDVDDVLAAFSEEVNSVMEHNGLITWLGNPAMRKRHWEKVYAKLEKPFI